MPLRDEGLSRGDAGEQPPPVWMGRASVAPDWREIVQAAAMLMASGHYTSVKYAVETARELVVAAKEGV